MHLARLAARDREMGGGGTLATGGAPERAQSPGWEIGLRTLRQALLRAYVW